jgi:hypothetical protein
MLSYRQVKAACPVAWQGDAVEVGNKWLTGEPLYQEFHDAALRVVSPLTGPGRGNHLIRREDRGSKVFYLAELHSYRYEVERYQLLVPGRVEDPNDEGTDEALVMVYEVEGPGCQSIA